MLESEYNKAVVEDYEALARDYNEKCTQVSILEKNAQTTLRMRIMEFALQKDVSVVKNDYDQGYKQALDDLLKWLK
ncbi:hypothetical protein VNN36_09025 [Lactococcus garvieae]|uniref:hypothetical protein n=1 Tax=Lactococcus garvieae TaxID=1363 RepID=UPI0030D16F57